MSSTLEHLFESIFCFFPTEGIDKQQFLDAIQSLLKEAKINDAIVIETLGIQIGGVFLKGGAFVYLNDVHGALTLERYLEDLIHEGRIKTFMAILTNLYEPYCERGLRPLLIPKKTGPVV